METSRKPSAARPASARQPGGLWTEEPVEIRTKHASEELPLAVREGRRSTRLSLTIFRRTDGSQDPQTLPVPELA